MSDFSIWKRTQFIFKISAHNLFKKKAHTIYLKRESAHKLRVAGLDLSGGPGTIGSPESLRAPQKMMKKARLAP